MTAQKPAISILRTDVQNRQMHLFIGRLAVLMSRFTSVTWSPARMKAVLKTELLVKRAVVNHVTGEVLCEETPSTTQITPQECERFIRDIRRWGVRMFGSDVAHDDWRQEAMRKSA
jgi:hypothetical protein